MAPHAAGAAAVLVISLIVPSLATEMDGVFEQVVPSTASGALPPGRLWHTGAASGAQLFIAGGSSTMHTDSFAYNAETNSWEQRNDMPAALKAADMTISGGIAIVFGGKTEEFVSSMQFVRLPTDEHWTVALPSTAPQPAPRDAHTIAEVSGVVYLFGGWDESQYFNDLWSLDVTGLTNYTKGTPPVKWVQAVPNGVAESPPRRNSHSFSPYGGRVYLFGGFAHDVETAGPWVQCSPSDRCHFYNDVWVLGTPTLAPKVQLRSSPWVALSPAAPNGRPEGRYGHSASIVGESLYIFGGKTQTNLLNDMWELNLAVNEWVKRDPSGPRPGARYSAIAATIGPSMYLFSGSNERSDLWKFTPATLKSLDATIVPSVNGSSSGSGDDLSTISLGGVNAGLVIAILVGLANLALMVLIYRRGGRGGSMDYRAVDATL